MRAIAKAILITIVVSICLVLFINFAFFFPWYMTLVLETFHLSQAVASDNYLKQNYYDKSLEKLEEKPIFRDKRDQIEITVLNADGAEAIGHDDESFYRELEDYEKPYRQRGKPLTVTISAVYPLSITLWGKQYEREIPLQFTITTTGLKHYKDLGFYFDGEG